MPEFLVLGIDCGGTHTDAALLNCNSDDGKCRIIATAKTPTMHQDLPGSIKAVVEALDAGPSLHAIKRIALGTTLEINAIVQNKADKVGLALSAGPGLDPIHFILGEHACIVPGGLDHRGQEVQRLYLDVLRKEAAAWPGQDVAAIACVSKFSPRSPDHERQMGEVAAKASGGLPVTLGHTLSGQLNFPRRIATAYYNASVKRIHEEFLQAVEKYFAAMGVSADLFLLKADGGAIPFAVSRKEPVQSILSGPAASVMGILAIWPGATTGCSLICDMGGTTTDIAMFVNGSPVIDRNGMKLGDRRTLVRSLASVSIGVGGDSMLSIETSGNGEKAVKVGPLRTGPAMAFGGDCPTLLDAFNFVQEDLKAGDAEAGRKGILKFAAENGIADAQELAEKAIDHAMAAIAKAAYDLVENINANPIYTLAALKAVKEARPEKICLVGGPARIVERRLEKALGLPVEICPHSQVANAIGAAVTKPTATLEIYADTGKGVLEAPSINYKRKIFDSLDLPEAERIGCNLLAERLKADGLNDPHVEVLDSDIFATLDDRGYGAKDIRVSCQLRPGIIGHLY